MEVKTGLFDKMVLQRNRNNCCDAHITGVCAQRHTGVLTATVSGDKGVLSGFKELVIGRARGGKFAGRLRGLASGGPYSIVLTVRSPSGTALEEITVVDVLVGDVWMLGGQSNMQGVGRLCDALKPHPMVRAMYMNDEWDIAKDPIHVLDDSVDVVHSGLENPNVTHVRMPNISAVGVGPGIGFAQEMLRKTGVPQGLLACAHGGTSMTQWNPALKRLGSRSLYGAMLRRFVKSGGKVAGMIWYQGENDTHSSDEVKQYTGRMKRLVSAVRRDFRQPQSPWVIAQLAGICGNPSGAAFWNQIQEQQRCLPRQIKNLLTVPTIDLALEDTGHVAGREMPRLGCRMAQAMLVLRRDPARGLPPIELGGISFEADSKHSCMHVVLSFKNVIGQLQAAGRPTGFSVIDRDGSEKVCCVELRKQAVVLRVVALHPGLVVSYGRGLLPYCNITDGADRSLPVFGPLSLDIPQAWRSVKALNAAKIKAFNGAILADGFVTNVLVSRPLSAPADISNLQLPKNFQQLGLKRREFPGGFWNLHYDLFDCAPNDRLVYFVCYLICSKPASINLGVGYDGPVKIWVDGNAVYCDPKGSNPATVDKALIPVQLSKGRHTAVFALSSNHGRAWGIRFRCMSSAPDKSGRLTVNLPFLKIKA